MYQAKARSCRRGQSSVKGLNTGLFPGAAITQPAFGWALDLTRGSHVTATDFGCLSALRYSR